MSKEKSSFEKKPTINPALHEGLLLLIHEHFKAQMINNNPSHDANADTSSTSFSFDFDYI